MTPLVETVARAISRKVDSYGDTERVEQQRASLEWPRYREHAQAAIAAVFDALETPSEGMVEAAAETPGMKVANDAMMLQQGRGYPIDPAAFADGSPLQQAWKAMLARFRKEAGI